jgi:4-hydroxybenzoate polyprenyltransferase
VVVADVISVSFGFLLRVAAGGFVIGAELSPWLILCTFFAACMIACCKRRAELLSAGDSKAARAVLADYSLPFLDLFITIAASASMITYALYTVSDRTVAFLGTGDLIYTIPLVLYGLLRYLFLVYRYRKGEDPAVLIARDFGMIVAILLWLGLSFIIVYRAL